MSANVLKLTLKFVDFKMDSKMTELEDDCLVSELIDHFIETLNIPKFFACKD